MVNRNFLLSALAAAATGAIAQDSGSENIRFGNAFSLGATTSYIVEAETTLYPGKTQSGDTPRLALWPGMGTDENQLIQAIVLASSDAQGAECGGEPHVNGEWCAFASALQNDVQLQGATFPVKSNQGYDETSGNTTQTVSIEGKIVSTLSTKSGKAIGFGTAEEAQNEFEGVVYEHSYVNTTVVLAATDAQFASTLGKTGATGTLVTKDNKTFKVDKITIAEYSFPASV
ncbi:hypothetical protein E4T50_12104 [Aureobasidium sp. EXF-12298]|nr:hypothetical protein E4T50_12104 [Aureobasidium sp. EXF-12298]KAI4754967.1 hypothetical protein E4T51_11932 [Aureobasidium sp. EXF-12344]KAI4772059.1 hypothetical protein E4T52_12949 [Aureobasidium sp. EXF-3400]